MFGYMILFILFIGACGWILFPLLKEGGRRDDFAARPVDTLQALKNKKNSIYAVIKELEFDLNMGKLTREDFDILKRQYTQEAIGYMKEIDQLEVSRAANDQEAH